MKQFIYIPLILGFVGIASADQGYPTPERQERWERLSQNLTYHNLFVMMDEMISLPSEPWPEPLKQILLKMTVTYQELIKAGNMGTPIIIPDFVSADKCGEIFSYIHSMVSWQADVRFISFLGDFNGQGAASEGLARIGEPAFETVIKAFDVKGYPTVLFEAARTISLMMQKEDGFLRRDPVKQTIARHALLKSVRLNKNSTQSIAIDVLRFFPDAEVFALLETISQTDPRMVNGQYPLRLRAQEALAYLRSH